MTYRDAMYISTDSHVTEPIEVYGERVDVGFRGRVKPSELIRRQCSATFMYDPVAINNRATTGIETLMWGNDYPHPEGTWPDSQAVNADQFDGVSQHDLDAIVNGNAARVFGFDLDHLATLQPVPA